MRTVACVQGGPGKFEAGSKLDGKREKIDGGMKASQLHPTTGVFIATYKWRYDQTISLWRPSAELRPPVKRKNRFIEAALHAPSRRARRAWSTHGSKSSRPRRIRLRGGRVGDCP